MTAAFLLTCNARTDIQIAMPPKPIMTSLLFLRVPDVLTKKLDKYAVSKKMTKAAVVREAIAAFFKRSKGRGVR